MKKSYDAPVFENLEQSEVVCAEINVSQWKVDADDGD